MRILIAEDNVALAHIVRQELEAEGYELELCGHAEDAVLLTANREYNLLMVDLELGVPELAALVRRLRRERPDAALLLLTSWTGIESRVEFLDAGADDYILKPFALAELAAKVRALLRRSGGVSSSVLKVGDLRLDRMERRVERGGRKIDLTSKEFSLLEYLMRNAGRRITRPMIIEHVWNVNFERATNVVDVYINFLRVVFEATLVSAEHLAYQEYLQRCPELSYIASFRLMPLSTNAVLQLDLGAALPIIELMLGGQGKDNLATRETTEIEEQILESVVRIILRELQSSWQKLSLEFVFEERQRGDRVQRLMRPDEKILCLSFEIHIAEARGSLNLAIPAVVSNALLRKMSADWAYPHPQGPSTGKGKVRERLLHCGFDVAVEVADIPVKARDLLNVTVGDLLLLRRSASTPAFAVVAGQRMFTAAVGRKGTTRVAQVLQPMAPQTIEEEKQ